MTDENITITTYSICFDIFLLLVGSYSFITYFIYSYATIPNDLKYNYVSNLLLSYIIISILYSVNNIVSIIYKIKYNRKTISKKIWNIILPSNRFPLSILKLSFPALLIVGNWICFIFVPIESNNCSIYTENSNACYSMKIISVLMLFNDVVIGLCVLLFILLVFYAMCNGIMICSDCSCSNLTNQFFPKFIIDRLQNYNPIPRFVSSDDDCAICLDKLNNTSTMDTTSTMDNISTLNNTSTFDNKVMNKQENGIDTLPCGHKYHKNCVNEWFTSGATTCPTCRFEVTNILERIVIN